MSVIRRNSITTLIVAAVLALSTSLFPARIESSGGDVEVSASEILDHIKYLSSEELEGRGTGEVGCEKAAEYIAGVFAEAGLSAAGDNGSYLQAFDAVVGAAVGEGNELSATVGDVRRSYEIDKGFRPLSFSESGTVIGDVVFAGYGITAPRYGYDDYDGIEVKGKVVLVMRHEPAEDDEDSPFEGTSLTYYSDLSYKAMNAREHGASALVLFTDPLNHEDVESELLEFDPRAGKTSAGIPCIQMALAGVRQLFVDAGLDLEDIQAQIDEAIEPRSMTLEGVHLSIATSVSRDARRAYNVLGRLDGSDPDLSHETVVVGAHYDHLGIKDGEVHPGADDNASGTAALLELARMLPHVDPPPGRSILFIAFSGEEIGLLGSSHAASVLLPNGDSAPRTAAASGRPVAMMNMDMVGRLREDELMVGGVGSSPAFRPMLEDNAKGHGFVLDYSEAGYGPSDHSSFYAKGIPVLFFFTGVHDDHHRPTDTWEKINAEGEARVVSFVLDVVRSLASRSEAIAFDLARGESEEPPGGERYGGYGRARLGIVPDFGGSDVEGVKITGVREGSPAEEAGLEGGDIIVSFDGRACKSLQDLSYFLKDKKPGDPVIIIVQRGGEQVALQAVLGAREGRGHQ